MEMNLEEIWEKLGLEPYEFYPKKTREFALRNCNYYSLGRQTGRTTQSAVITIKFLSERKRVLLVAGNDKQARHFYQKVVDFAAKCGIDASAIEYCKAEDFLEGRFQQHKFDIVVFDHTAKEASNGVN